MIPFNGAGVCSTDAMATAEEAIGPRVGMNAMTRSRVEQVASAYRNEWSLPFISIFFSMSWSRNSWKREMVPTVSGHSEIALFVQSRYLP